MSKRLPKELEPILQSLYRPDYAPEDLKVAEALKLDEDDLKIVEERIKEVEERLFQSDAPKPITAEEAAVIEQKVDETRDAIAATRSRIASVRARIDKQAAPDGQAEIAFKVDLRKKQALRRAVKAVFGIKPSALTYSMYKTCLEAKRQIEDQEASDYTNGNWGDD